LQNLKQCDENVLKLVEDMALVNEPVEQVKNFATHHELVQVIKDVQGLMEDTCNFVGEYVSSGATSMIFVLYAFYFVLKIVREVVFNGDK
jgi:predicted PurR-regulated permease PerM